jgi:hypothetical protein
MGHDTLKQFPNTVKTDDTSTLHTIFAWIEAAGAVG